MEPWSQKAKLGCLLELSGTSTPWQAEQWVYHTEFLTRMVAVIALAYSFLELCGTARLQLRHISRGRRTYVVQPPGLISIWCLEFCGNVSARWQHNVLRTISPRSITLKAAYTLCIKSAGNRKRA